MAEVNNVEENLQELRNLDEDILLKGRVDPSSKDPVLNQALRIAVYDEYKAYETYKKVLEKFGDVEPFTKIIEAEVTHYQALIPLLEKYEVEIPVNDLEAKIEEPNSILEACEVGVAAELENIKMYDNLINYVKEYPDVLDLIYQLQAVSYNNHLPAFRACVAKLSNNETLQSPKEQIPFGNLEEMMGEMDELNEIASKAASGNFSQDDIMRLLSNKNVSLIGGALIGALGAGVVSQMVKDKEENKDGEEE